MKVLPFTLLLREPVLATAPGGDPNTDESEKFIPGSAIRGALASRYRQTHKADAAFHQLFLNGKTCFLDAYPAGEKWVRTLPPPRYWATLKDAGDKIYNLAKDIVPKDEIPKPVKQAFIEIAEDKVVPMAIDYEIAVHTARDRELGRATEESGELFRYRALATGQQFTGAIVVENTDDVTTLQNLLASGELVLGGSRSAGYGLTRVTVGKEAEAWLSWREKSFGKVTAVAAGDTFVVYLASDAILRDPETGQETADILSILQKCWPAHKISTAPEPYAFASMGWVGGFNQKWGLPLPQTWAARRGSVWLLEAKQSLTVDDITTLEQAGIGERRAEGYGRVIINPHCFVDGLSLTKPAGIFKGSASGNGRVSESSQKLIDQMNERIVRRDLDRFVVAAAQAGAQRSRGRLSNSQLARLRLQARNGLETFGKYLTSTHERKSADDQFRKFMVNGRNFRQILEELAQEPGQVWEKILPDGWSPTTVGDMPSPRHNHDLTHHYAVRYVDAICEQLAKKGGN